MTKEELEIGKFYSCGGEPVYKLEDIGEDWVLVLHYSTVHYVADAQFFKLEEFLSDFHEDEDDYWNDCVFNDLVFSDWQTLHDKNKN